MIFNSTISKIGKAKNISVYMPNKNKILLYYFNDGIFLKTIDFSSGNTVLTKTSTDLAFNEVYHWKKICFWQELEKAWRKLKQTNKVINIKNAKSIIVNIKNNAKLVKIAYKPIKETYGGESFEQ